jgi:hypothetical protein
LVLILKGIVNLALTNHCLAEPSKCALMNGTLKQMIVAWIIEQAKPLKLRLIRNPLLAPISSWSPPSPLSTWVHIQIYALLRKEENIPYAPKADYDN